MALEYTAFEEPRQGLVHSPEIKSRLPFEIRPKIMYNLLDEVSACTVDMDQGPWQRALESSRHQALCEESITSIQIMLPPPGRGYLSIPLMHAQTNQSRRDKLNLWSVLEDKDLDIMPSDEAGKEFLRRQNRWTSCSSYLVRVLGPFGWLKWPHVPGMYMRYCTWQAGYKEDWQLTGYAIHITIIAVKGVRRGLLFLHH